MDTNGIEPNKNKGAIKKEQDITTPAAKNTTNTPSEKKEESSIIKLFRRVKDHLKSINKQSKMSLEKPQTSNTPNSKINPKE